MAFFRSVSALSKLRSRVVGQQPSLANSVRCLQMQTSINTERVKKLKKEHGSVELGKITADMGIRFRGMIIPDCQKTLTGAFPGGEPLPEAILWLLLTGKIPNKEQVDSLAQELRSRAKIPEYAYKAIDGLPVSAHPMTQFTTGVMALQEVLRWIRNIVKEFGTPNISTEQLSDYIHKTLNSGQVVPGYGHGVLCNTDPRYTCQREFALKHLPNDPLFQLVSKIKEVVPPILTKFGLCSLADPYIAFGAALNGFAGPPHGLANQVPVGEGTVMNVENKKGNKNNLEEIIYTGIKVIDLLSPIRKGGSIGFLGPHGERKTELMLELMKNNGGFSVYSGVGKKETCTNLLKAMEQKGLINKKQTKSTLVFSELSEPVGAHARSVVSALALSEHFRDAEQQDIYLFIDNIYLVFKAHMELQYTMGIIPSLDVFERTVSSDFSYIQKRLGIGQKGGSITLFSFVEDKTELPLDVTLVVTEGNGPIIDPLSSSSSMLSQKIIGLEHYSVAESVLIILENYKNILTLVAKRGVDLLFEEDKVTIGRARKVLFFLKQPFTGKHVSIKENLSAFTDIIKGKYDHYPEQLFDNVGDIKEVEAKFRDMTRTS